MTNPIKTCTLLGLVIGVITGAYQLGQINETSGFPALLDFVSVGVKVLSIVVIGAIVGIIISLVLLMAKKDEGNRR